MNPEQLVIATLLHEMGHFRALAGPNAPAFPLPQGFAPTAESEARVRKAYGFALQGEAPAAHSPAFLQPILPSLAGQKTTANIPPLPVGTSAAHLPQAEGVAAGYAETWRQLCQAAQTIRTWPPDRYATALENLLARYAHNIPGPNGAADLSLHARARTAAAFSRALWPSRGEGPLCLIGGELSGIQEFLYDVGTVFAGNPALSFAALGAARKPDLDRFGW
jgi:hypothetical protein